MTLATLVVYGRYWYDFLTFAVVVAFFLIEMLLLFRNTLLGWAMTAKCLILALLFSYAILNPPMQLPPEDVSIVSASLRAALITILTGVIVILAVMRTRRQTVVVGTVGEAQAKPYNPVFDPPEDKYGSR